MYSLIKIVARLWFGSLQIDEDHEHQELEQMHEGTDDEDEVSDMKSTGAGYACRDVGRANDGPSPNDDIITQVTQET